VGFFKKLKKAVSKVVKIGVKTAPLWSSFIPGGSIAAKLATGGKLGKVAGLVAKGRALAARHPKVVGLIQNVRRARHVAPGRTPTAHIGGWARTAGQMPANPYMNGKAQILHGRKLAALRRYHPGSGVMSRRASVGAVGAGLQLAGRRRRRYAA